MSERKRIIFAGYRVQGRYLSSGGLLEVAPQVYVLACHFDLGLPTPCLGVPAHSSVP